MSSIMEKMSSESLDRPAKLEKRNFFLRSSSIQKIKCSATYPFRIAGSKLSREAIKQLIESLIIKARLFSQKALLILYIATLKVLGAITPVSSSLSANDGVYVKLKETEKELTFIERLLARMIKLHVHKLRYSQVDKAQDNKKDKELDLTTEAKVQADTVVENKLVDISATKKLLSVHKTEKPRKQNLLVIAVVYASAIFIYIQLLALTIALNTAPTPPGLIFLIVSLSLIGYLAFQVFFQNSKRRVKRSNNSRKNSRNQESRNGQENKDSVQANKQDRFRIRRNFDFGDKTLSKIKML